MLVTVSAFREPYEAHLFCGRLQTEGIVAFVAHETWIANEWPMSVAFGGVKVQVLQHEFETAREIERACCRGDYRELLLEEFGDLDDPVCPACGCTEYRKRRPFPRAALAIAVSLTLGTVLPPWGWILCCEHCGKEYRTPRPTFSTRIGTIVAAGLAVVMVEGVLVWLWNARGFWCHQGPMCY